MTHRVLCLSFSSSSSCSFFSFPLFRVLFFVFSFTSSHHFLVYSCLPHPSPPLLTLICTRRWSPVFLLLPSSSSYYLLLLSLPLLPFLTLPCLQLLLLPSLLYSSLIFSSSFCSSLFLSYPSASSFP